MTAVIRLEDIMKTYVMGDAVVHALDHVSVEIGAVNLLLLWDRPAVVNQQ